MSGHRHGDSQHPVAVESSTGSADAVGKTTLTQALQPAAMDSERAEGSDIGAFESSVQQDGPDQQCTAPATSRPDRSPRYDIRALFGSPSAAAGVAGKRGASNTIDAAATSGAAQRAPAAASPAAQPGMWEHTFGEASTVVGKLGRVQAPKGVYLRERPLPGASSRSAPIPFNSLVFVERRTNQGNANERWCFVIATEAGSAGFCEERYLAIDPPEPTATLHRTAPGERLATIAEQAYGAATDKNNSRLYVQALYLANRERAGVQLEHVDLSFKDRALRGEDERNTLEVYKGAKVIAGTSLWLPSKAFIDQLNAAGAVTGGSTLVTEAWDTAKGAVTSVVDGAKYVAGFVTGLLEGAYNAIVDLFKGAVDMVEAVLKVVWNLITGNPGRVREMASGWVEKMKAAWEHRGEIADEFLKRWNAESAWDRGLFQGEVLGWVAMTVLLVLVTMGEDAPAALAGIAVRWPQLVRLLKTVDTLGDVTTYLGAAAKAAKLPGTAARFLAGKLGKAERVAEHVAEDVGKDAERLGHKAEAVAEHGQGKAPEHAASPERTPERGADGGTPESKLLLAFRKAKKFTKVEAVSLKRLRITLGQAGATPGKYKLVRATEQELAAIGGEASGVFGWVARDGANNIARDVRGRPIITFTPRALASLEEAVKTFGHEVQHLKDFAAGVVTSSESLAEEAGEKLWIVVQAMKK